MEKAAETSITSKKGSYPEISAALKREAISKITRKQREFLARHPEKTDLSDLAAVTRLADAYVESCSDMGILPTMEGLAAALAVSRKWLYEFMRVHSDTPTAVFLEQCRTSWAAARIAAAELGAVDNVLTIFLLKNSGLGFTDRQEITLEPPQVTPLSDLDAAAEAAARRRILEAIPEAFDDTDGDE